MSKNCNGIKDVSPGSPKSAVEPLESDSTTDHGNQTDFAVDTNFRGFAKVPIVLVPREDITPYLNAKKTPQNEEYKPGKSLGNHHIYKYATKLIDCKVNVLRDDLDQLKHNFRLTYNMLDMFITCRICKKIYPDLKKLQNHQATKHMIVYEQKPRKRVSFSDHVIIHEVKEYHKCRKCTRIFENYRSLKTHMKKDHKKRKCYICFYCTKSFVDRTIFKVHMKLHCDNCGELFANKAKYSEHRRYVCRVLKLHKCRTCNLEFFKFMDLKEHSYDHLGTFFICDICKDQFETKCAVSHHIQFLHSKKRPTTLYEIKNIGNERLFLCNFCEETSVDKDVLESHVELLPDLSNRAMTGYKDYYFCDHCLRQFDKEQEMLQHKWTHFLKASESETKENKELHCETTNNAEICAMHENIPPNRFFNINEKIPERFLPKVILKRMENKLPSDKVTEEIIDLSDIDDVEYPKLNPQITNTIDVTNTNPPSNKIIEDIIDLSDIDDVECPNLNRQIMDIVDVTSNTDVEYPEIIPQIMNKAIVDPKSKKTLLSRHQCDHCDKYFSNAYCLRRHIQTVHFDYENLKCRICEETFVWPSLLQTHKCIRDPIPEMPFDDARPEIHFDNLNMIEMLNRQAAQELQESNGIADDDYNMNCVDFEIPIPVVELTEYENTVVPNNTFVNHDHGILNGSRLLNGNIVGHGLPDVEHGPTVPGYGQTVVSQGQNNVSHGQNIVGHGHAVVGDRNGDAPLKRLGYKVVMQEVPIEF